MQAKSGGEKVSHVLLRRPSYCPCLLDEMDTVMHESVLYILQTFKITVSEWQAPYGVQQASMYAMSLVSILPSRDIIHKRRQTLLAGRTIIQDLPKPCLWSPTEHDFQYRR